MNRTGKTDRIRKLLLSTVVAITFIILASISLSNITNLRINLGDTVKSETDLDCYWTIDSSTDVNVTWYKNDQLNRNLSISCTNGVECSTSIGSGTVLNNDTLKGEHWTCEIGYSNGTAYEVKNVTVTIVDTPPSQPRIYNESSIEILNTTIVTIPEDSNRTFDINSTDADPSDTITYLINDTTYCNISGTTGIMTCNPTLESHVGFRVIRISADTDDAATRQILNINVTRVNDAPVFNPALVQKNLTNNQIFNYRIIGADDENNTPLNLIIANVTPYLNLTVSVVNNYTFYLMLTGNRTATYQESLQNYTVTLTLNDTDNVTNNSKSRNGTFTLVGVTVNILPNISYIVYDNTSLVQGGQLRVYLNATDDNNNTLTFATGGSLYPINSSSATYYSSNISEPSRAYASINITNLTNDYVINNNITVYVFDTYDNGTKVIPLNITNINDAPVVHEMSYNSSNSHNNSNMSRLIGYVGVQLRYKVNATDGDDMTYDANNTGLSYYSTNDSARFGINATTGVLTFTPNASGNYSFTVNATDKGGLSSSRTAYIEIFNNSNPAFSGPIIISCFEYDNVNRNTSCYYNLSANVSDQDNLSSGDYITNYWTNSTFFTVNSTTGIINFTANQSIVGNYSIMFNVTDSHEGMNSTTITVRIYNTNNRPNITSINIPMYKMVIGTPYSIVYDIYDLDLELNNSYETLNFSVNITGNNISIFNLTNISATQAQLMILPYSENSEGNYTVNFTVTDFYNNKSSNLMNIYIYNATSPPTIHQVIPTGTPYNNTINNVTWVDAANFTNMTTNIIAYENQTLIFNQTSSADASSYSNSLAYQWYYDGFLVATTSYYPKYFDFFSNGSHTLAFVAIDEYGINNSFHWNINVSNTNRPPTYNNNTVYNLTISGSGSWSDYMTNKKISGVTVPVFYDLDDDPAGTGYTEDDTTSLIFSASFCPYANFSFGEYRLTIDAYEIGECYVIFTASDALNSSMSASSEIVLINITNVSQNSIPEPVPINVETTGGGSERQPVPIPMPEEVEKPKPLNLITPKLVTVYKNSTIKIPIVINNTWNDSLIAITLEAATNASNVSMYLDKIYIPKLNKNEYTEANLYLRNYKSEGHYEIQIKANVSIPHYIDTATIYINSAEMRSEGEELENKISFAQDLLSSNPECQELNELLGQAKTELGNDNFESTARIIDNVINGCKFLVNNAKQNKEMPDRDFVKTLEWKKSYTDYAIIGFFAVLFMISLIYILKKDSPEENF